MPLLVDTYNVLHVTGVLPPDLAGVGVAELIEMIERSRYANDVTFLICDGVAGARQPGGTDRVRVHYSGHSRLADDVIARMVEKSSAPRRLVIVSSDREVQRAGRRRRCRILTSEAFLRQLADDAELQHRDRTSTDPPASEPTLGWMSAFGVDDPERFVADLDAEVELPSALHPADPEPEPAPEPAPDEASSSISSDPVEKPPAPPVLPMDILLEAHRMTLDADVAEPIEDVEASAEAPTTPTEDPAPMDASPPGVPDITLESDSATLPDDLVREAEALLRELTGIDVSPDDDTA